MTGFGVPLGARHHAKPDFEVSILLRPGATPAARPRASCRNAVHLDFFRLDLAGRVRGLIAIKSTWPPSRSFIAGAVPL